MKNNLFLLLSTLLFSCNNEKATEEIPLVQTIDSVKTTVQEVPKIDTLIKDEPFEKYIARAVLIGEKIELLNSENKIIKDISSQNENIVSVLERSKKINIYKDQEECNEYRWVKIKVGTDTGFVDGNKLYELYKHKQTKTYKVGTNEVSISITKAMGQREFDESEDPLYCYSNKPIIFKDKEMKYEGLVKTVKNNHYDKNESIFNLYDDDGRGDEVKKIELIDNKYILSIIRVKQEGGAKIKVAIYFDENKKCVAEIFEYKDIEEDELQKQLKQ